ncbi:MAG: hypothetical protein DWG80_05695 [Chloroflexi bacterium]|nr:hypothetical protein [Chloroflexota bacterium]
METQATSPANVRGIRGSLFRVLTHRLARVAYAGAASAIVDFGVFNLLLLALDRERTMHVLAANSGAWHRGKRGARYSRSAHGV